MKRKITKLDPGQKLGKLTIIKIVGEKRYGSHRDFVWECKCDCGKTCTRTEHSLTRTEHVHSCGCYSNQNLHPPQDQEHYIKAGKARAEKRNKDGVNVDMLFRDKPISTNTSGVQGVSWSNTAHKWHVYIGYKSKRANLGYYESLELAKTIREEGIKAIKNGYFEEFYYEVRGKNF